MRLALLSTRRLGAAGGGLPANLACSSAPLCAIRWSRPLRDNSRPPSPTFGTNRERWSFGVISRTDHLEIRRTVSSSPSVAPQMCARKCCRPSRWNRPCCRHPLTGRTWRRSRCDSECTRWDRIAVLYRDAICDWVRARSTPASENTGGEPFLASDDQCIGEICNQLAETGITRSSTISITTTISFWFCPNERSKLLALLIPEYFCFCYLQQ